MAIWKIFRSCTKGIHSINITNDTRPTLDQQLINISIDTQLTLSAVCQKSAECGLIHMHQSKICYLNRLSTEMLSIETESNDSQLQMTFVHIIQIFKLKQRHKQMNHAIFSHIMPGAGCAAAWLFTHDAKKRRKHRNFVSKTRKSMPL